MDTTHCPERGNRSPGAGKLLVVGIGPGSREDRTFRAVEAIRRAEVIVGYHKYVDLVADLCAGKTCIATGMTRERERVAYALSECRKGKIVALISSGDPGVYGMAGLVLQMIAHEADLISVEIIPGITAANAAASRLGAPLMSDYCCVSLSDLLVPWEKIARRLEAAASGDFVTALYNPRSHRRHEHLEKAVDIFARYRPLSTPVGIVHFIGLVEERVELKTLGTLLQGEVHMRSLVIIGNRSSLIQGDWLIAPRGYFADGE